MAAKIPQMDIDEALDLMSETSKAEQERAFAIVEAMLVVRQNEVRQQVIRFRDEGDDLMKDVELEELRTLVGLAVDLFNRKGQLVNDF